MGIRDAIQAFGTALRKGPMIPIAGGPSIAVVNTNLPPTQGDVPLDWSSAWMGPGQAFTISQSSRDKDKETEPRSFQYNPNINATISPRLAYGLMPFTSLRAYAETVPEVSQCINIITEELKAFTPTLVDREENILDFVDLRWMTTKPDGYYPWSVWMSRFLYSTLAYDAGCAYLVRDGDRIIAARVVDGSTIFPLVDERGEQPAPPAPAFTQVLYGTPYQYYNTRQLYYRPRHLRVESPYGRSPIEDAVAAVQLLQNLWDYEAKKYAEGNIPECLFRAPVGWSVDQVLEAERAWNARMVGSNAERVRARFIPNGFEFVLTKNIEFNVSSHDVAANTVRLAFGIPQSEVGDAPGGGLGGSGYAEAMQSAFYRMALAPNIMYIEQLFNHILDENGFPEIRFKMQFPNESINPQAEEEKQMARFAGGVVTRDEARQSMSLNPLGGELGEYLVDPKPQGQPGDMFGGGIPASFGSQPEMKRPIRVEKADFDEIEHPRTNDGKFTAGAGGAEGKSPEEKSPKDQGGAGAVATASESNGSSEYEGYSDDEVDDAGYRMEEKYSDWYDGLDDSEAEAIQDYTTSSYVYINRSLRNDDEYERNRFSDTIDGLNAALEKSSIPHNVKLHRGFGYKELYEAVEKGEVESGSTMQDKGFVSTSLSETSSEAFISQDYPVRMMIEAKKGASGGYVSHSDLTMADDPEYEMLLPAGSKMTVKSATMKTIGGKKMAYIEASYG